MNNFFIKKPFIKNIVLLLFGLLTALPELINAQGYYNKYEYRRKRHELSFGAGASSCLTDLGGRDAIGSGFLYDMDIAKKQLSKFFFCGITEDFDESISQLNNKLESKGVAKLEFGNVRENVTSTNFNDTQEVRIEKIFNEIGEDLTKELTKINQQDIELRNYAKNTFFKIMKN